MSFDDEVQFRDESVLSKASKNTTTQSHEKPKHHGLYDMFDIKGREGVDIAIARVFVSCDIPFNVSCSQYFEQMVHAINDGLAWFKALSYGNLRRWTRRKYVLRRWCHH